MQSLVIVSILPILPRSAPLVNQEEETDPAYMTTPVIPEPVDTQTNSATLSMSPLPLHVEESVVE